MRAYIRMVGLLVIEMEANATNGTAVTYQPVGGCNTSATTTNVTMEMKMCEAAEEEYAWREQDRRNSQEGIRELREWLAAAVATVLRRQIVVRLPARVVIQYCWRPGRWKSLT